MTGRAVAADRPHVWLPGSTEAPLLLLHGTGGSEHDLLPLRDLLAPGHTYDPRSVPAISRFRGLRVSEPDQAPAP